MKTVADKNREALKDVPITPNPNYGGGALRRKILLRKTEDTNRTPEQGQQLVVGELEDNPHCFRVRIYHDNTKVCDIDADALRYPNSTCPGAIDILPKLIGIELGGGPNAFYKQVNPKEFCTHMFDLACLAYTHASREQSQRLYHAVVHDETLDEVMDLVVTASDDMSGKNTRELLHIQHRHQVIESPEKYKGVNIQQGFMKWAAANLQGEELEAAIVLAKTNFVSLSRRVDQSAVSGSQLMNDIMPVNACYTYSSPVMETAYHLEDCTVDYSHNPEDMLQWVEVLD